MTELLEEQNRALTEVELARALGVSVRLLRRYERVGLIHAVRVEDRVVYEPDQVRRAWSVVTLHRDLGVNLAGVEIILEMSQRMRELQRQLFEVAQWLNEHRDALRRILEEQGETERR